MKLYIKITIVLMLMSSVLFAQRNTTTDPITVTGSITEVNHPIANFKSDDGTIYQIHMGPYRYWLNNGYTLNNETATIKGEVKTVDGVKQLYPNEVIQNGKTIKLADENGVPLWAGNKGNNGNGKGYGWKNGNKVYAKATILSRAHRNDEVLRTLDGYQNAPSGFRFCYLDYMTGLAKLNRLDPDADRYFIRFIKDFRGKNYISSAYHKLAWCFLLKSDVEKYREFTGKILNRGKMFNESDRQAVKEAQSKQVPGVILLKARLPSDGGYFQPALKEIFSHTVKEIVSSEKDMLEYHYRLGRIFQGSGDPAKAVFYFDKAIQEGTSQPYYFAANSALQAGLICEEKKDFSRAKQYFQKCLEMETTEYKTSLDQKARAGLQRVKKAVP